MEITTMTKGLTEKEIFKMTKNPNIKRMMEIAGETLVINAFILYEDTVPGSDTVQEILSLRTENEVYATNSPTFIRTFNEILNVFGDDIYTEAITIIKGISKNNREYITCGLE